MHFNRRTFSKIVHEGRTMTEEPMGNQPAFLRTLMHLLKLALLVLASTLLILYILATPLGLELFLFENLSATYSPSYPVLIKLFNLHTEVSLGYVFTAFVSVYVLCFAMAWKQRKRPYFSTSAFLSKPVSSYIRDPLFALPVVSSLTYIAVIVIHFLEESFGVPIGKPPLPSDPLLAFYELTMSPLTEEITYRILPIGVFLIVHLLALSKREKSHDSWKQRLKVCLLVLLSPEDAKEKLGLKTVRKSGLGGVSVDEWLMILFTSVFFAASHYFYAGTWMAGKFASTFVQGLVMGLSYLVYGIQAPILIHWFFNYYLYTFSLVEIVHPSLTVLNLISQELTLSLGVLGLLMLMFPKAKSLAETKMITPEALLHLVVKVKNEVVAKGGRLLFSLRHIDFLDLAMLILALGVFVLRLTIVNSPSPEVGEKYYETGFVFDESYYVNAARKMLAGEAVNNEHPPLAKAFIMLGIVLFGDNPLGWRIFSILASTMSLLLVYELALLLCRSKFASFSAALLFASDIMAFNIGQIGILDAPSMMFVLAGTILILKERSDIGGLLFGVAFLSKLSTIFTAGGIVLLWVLLKNLRRGSDSTTLSKQAMFVGRVILIAFITFLLGLWVYDATYNIFSNNPFQHLSYIYNYHSSLTYGSSDYVILPLEWINPFNPFPPVNFHVVAATEVINGLKRTYHPIAYYGLYTPLWWSMWVVMPLSLAETLYRIRRNEELGAGLFTLLWVAANFFPYVLLGYFMQRWVYPFYFYMTLPGLYIGLSHYLSNSKRSRMLLVALMFVQLSWFFIWFPVKPKVVIDFLISLGLPA
jgi:hypothetical protein